ncbi:universal stress protein [Undibacterium sp. TS12]|uniref:universal stress protein n=1 Tax=Undibacterium sp. TS12 TaxID=2908202 RepID=UPI001F4D05EE|nr:universal stress protein [Undibacterium sp. TS12]MCH8621937.1 universal stress protein [Undibacterium sp. TS12]
MNLNQKIIAWVDQSAYAANIADYATWAALRLDAPLEFMHVAGPFAGQEAFGRRSQVIDIRQAQDVSVPLTSAQLRNISTVHPGQVRRSEFKASISFGDRTAHFSHQEGEFSEVVQLWDRDIRLHVFGRRGLSPGNLGPDVRRCIRVLNRPVLIVDDAFNSLQRAMIVFDRGTICRRGIQLIASNPLFTGFSIHLLMCAEANEETLKAINWATNCLTSVGIEISAAFHQGEIKSQLQSMIKAQSIDLLVLAAYPYTPLRSMLLGHATTDFLRATTIPALLLRQLVDE